MIIWYALCKFFSFLAAVFTSRVVTLVLGVQFSTVLGFIAVIDAKKQIIPDGSLLCLVAIGIARVLLCRYPFDSAMVGMMIAIVPFTLVLLCPEALGGGDFKLVAAGGVFLGKYQALITYLLSLLLFSVIPFVYLKIKKKSTKTTAVPYGPYYAAAGIAVFFIGLL